MNSITNHNINFNRNPRLGQKVADNAHNIEKYKGVKKSAIDVFKMAKDSCWEFLLLPAYPLFCNMGNKPDKNEYHPKTSLGIGTAVAVLNSYENITKLNALNPKLKNTTFSQKRKFVNEFNESKLFNLKKATISKIIKSKQKSLVKDSCVKFPIYTTVTTGLFLGAEALYNLFWVKKSKQS